MTAPDPLIFSWQGRHVRIRHDDPRMGALGVGRLPTEANGTAGDVGVGVFAIRVDGVLAADYAEEFLAAFAAADPQQRELNTELMDVGGRQVEYLQYETGDPTGAYLFTTGEVMYLLVLAAPSPPLDAVVAEFP